MEIGKRMGFGGQKCRWGEENEGVGEIKYKGTWFLYTLLSYNFEILIATVWNVFKQLSLQ